jgi:hypothetical protein
MRAVTPAEASVVQCLLAFPKSLDAPASSAARLPRRTFQTARQRILAGGWVQYRHIPDPVIIGHPILSAAIIAPYAESLHDLLASARNESDCVVLWSLPQFVFGVFLSESSAAVERLHGRLFSSGKVRTLESISVDCSEPSIPAYFDFEGAWSRVMNLGHTIAYPQPLGGLPRTSTQESRSGEGRLDREAMARLLLSTTLTTDSGAIARLLQAHETFDSILEKRFLRKGYVHSRVILKLDSIPKTDPALPSRVAFVSGSVRDRSDPAAFFRDLVGNAGVRPFLFLTNGRKVFFATLAYASNANRKEVPNATGSARSIVETHLRDVGFWREELDDLLVLVDHRYHQLVSSELVASGPEGKRSKSSGPWPG